MLTKILAVAFLSLLSFYPSPDSKSQHPESQACNFTTNISPILPYTRLPLSLLNDETQVWPENLTCKPESFGYTTQEAQRLFEEKTFPSCEISPFSPSLFFRSNTLSMNCSGKYLLGPVSEKLGRSDLPELKQYSIPVPLNGEEFAIGTCEKDSEGFFDQVIYRNVVNKKSLQRAKKNLKSEPVNIVMLVLDSVSRRSFYRKLLKTVEFLNSQSEPVHDFYVHNVNGEFSADSFMPTFMGDVPFERLSDEELEGAPWDNSMIFKYMHDRGFVTSIATDDCGNDLAAFLGKNTEIDHKIASFFCAAEKFYNFENNAKKQRCIGNKNAHTYMLDYILEFSKNYQEVSRFSYVHLNTAHEGSGTVIKTLDEDLVSFLTEYWKLPGKKVLFLMGDHGMRYGSWFTQIDGSHEHRLPLLLISMSEDLAKTVPKSNSILSFNTKRLVTKFDLHLALKYLASGQFDSSLVCETSKKHRSFNIFLEAIPDTRSCVESGIPLFWCSCMPFIESRNLVKSKEIIKITREIVNQLNNVNLKPVSTLQTVCQELNLNKILNVKYQTSNKEIYYNVKFNVKESENALFEALVLVSQDMIKKRARDGFGSTPIFLTEQQYMKVMYVKRLDAYAGVCQEVCEYKGLDPMFCICKEFINLKKTEKSLVSRIYDRRLAVISDESCEKACQKRGMDCDEFAWVLFKTCSALPEICDVCEESQTGYSYAVNRRCYLENKKGQSCSAGNKGGLCYCKRVD